MTKIAILDDYQNAALKSADWQSLSGADIKVFNYFIEPEKRIDALKSFDIIVLIYTSFFFELRSSNFSVIHS